MVAVRSMGLALESLVGYHSRGEEVCTVTSLELQDLVEISNERFEENEKRIARFRDLLKKLSSHEADDGKRKGQEGEGWEDAAARRERKKAEGLARSEQLSKARQLQEPGIEETSNLGGFIT